jgi:hypothetical protein
MIQARVVIAGAQTNIATITHTDQYDPAPTSNTDGVVVLSPSPEVIPSAPPTVTSLQRFGLHAQPTEFVLAFSSALDPTRAQDVRNYTLRPISPHGHVGGRIPIVSAVYNPLADTVTLHPAHRLYLFRRYELVVNGMPPAGLASPSGILLDGQGNGIPGSNYVKIFGPSILAGSYPGFPAKTKYISRLLRSVHRHTLTKEPRLPDSASAVHSERTHPTATKAVLGRMRADAVDAVLGTIVSPLASRDLSRKSMPGI